jgi:predicted Zn-dependent protease
MRKSLIMVAMFAGTALMAAPAGEVWSQSKPKEAGPLIKPANSGKAITARQWASDKKLGSGAHPELLKEFGGAYANDKAAGYVAQVGGRMVTNSELPNGEFTFTLLNSRVINAFALPGGYVYISRQLMALMNDEAELASVLGHETGHVTDRHTARRMSRARTGSIATVLAGVLAGVATGSGELADLAMRTVGTGAQMFTLSYSRNQEFRADELGLKYMSGAGYDPAGAAAMLSSLGAQTSLDARLMGQDAERVPTWARTHPLTQDRVTRASQLATSLAPNSGARVRNRDAFLATLDGMIYDDDPEQGFIRGKTFAHPKLRLTFTAPKTYTIVDNGQDAVTMQGPSGAGAIFTGMPLAQGESLDRAIAVAWQRLAGKDAPYQLGQPQRSTISGMETAIAAGRVTDSRGTPLDIAIVAYRWDAQTSYQFIMLTPAALSAQVDPDLRTMVNSLRRLSADEAGALIERRVRIITVQPGDTMASLAERMAFDDAKLERFRVLNGLDANAALKPGQKLKIIVYSRG